MTHRSICVALLVCVAAAAACASAPPGERLLVGYWHNWTYPNALRLTDTPEAFDTVNVAFATPTVPSGATMQFVPSPDIYPDPADFLADVQALQAAGKHVLISIGGAADPVAIENEADASAFAASMLTIINTYGFDGIDVDLEGQSLHLDAGDTDFMNPTSPRIVYFIDAMHELLDQLPSDFIVTAAPETAFVQGGYGAYAGVWGAYLPVLHALRDRWTFVHVQHYNTGSMYGRDGQIYSPATADFHVAMADMLLAGFPVAFGAGGYFGPLAGEQVAIGLPASVQAAGSGYTPPNVVHDALSYLYLGADFGGSYVLSNPDGYPDFRGLMTWSVNWDVDNDQEFSTTHRLFLDQLDDACAGDLDGDDDTDLADLGVLLASYDIDGGGDLNGDGNTDLSDLGILLADWGCTSHL
jgi:chitinase